MELTDAMRAQIIPWADMWIARGLCTDPADLAAWEPAAAQCYAYAGLTWPGVVVRVGSPIVVALSGALAAAAVEAGGGSAMLPALTPRIRSLLGPHVDPALIDAVVAAVSDVIRRVPSVSTRAPAPTIAALRRAVADRWAHYLGGSMWLNWSARTSFFRHVCHVALPGDLWDRDRAYATAQQSVGWWWPHERFVIVGDRPAEIHREQIGPRGWGSHRLHREGGPALRYRDGWALYVLHGVRMEPWMVMEPTEMLDSARVLGVQNAQQRAELIRRAGVGRLLKALPHRVIDTRGTDRLLSVQLSDDVRDARYLEMVNPSVPGLVHIEGVAPDCATVQQAHNWRASGDKEKPWNPSVLT